MSATVEVVARRSGARRVVATGLVLGLLALAVVGNATVRQRRAAARGAGSNAISSVSLSSGATSTAWYCAGPLPLGLKDERSSVAVVNVSHHAVRGQLLVSSSTGLSVTEAIDVGPDSQLVRTLPAGRHTSFGAATVLADGAGIGVEEIIHGPAGTQSAPCVRHASATAYFAGGSTADADNVALAVYDPGATPAVANVSFATSSGLDSPPTFQGLPIGAGQVVVLDVGHAVPLRQVVAAMVTATGGDVVSGAMVSELVAKKLLPALITGSPAAQLQWYVGASAAGANVRNELFALNPTTRPTTATVRFGGSAGSAEQVFSIPAQSSVSLSPAPGVIPGALRFATVTARSAPIVVLDENALLAALPAPASHAPAGAKPAKGATKHVVRTVASVLGLPSLPPGLSLITGSPVLAERWLVAGGESTASSGELVSIANPSSRSVQASVALLEDGRLVALPALSHIALGPDGAVALNLVAALGSKTGLAALVTVSAPAVVENLLYVKGSSGSVGLSASPAIPVG